MKTPKLPKLFVTRGGVRVGVLYSAGDVIVCRLYGKQFGLKACMCTLLDELEYDKRNRQREFSDHCLRCDHDHDHDRDH